MQNCLKKVFYGRKKQKILLKNCKRFFKKKKYISAESLFILGGSPPPIGYGPIFISVNFGNIFDQW